MDDVLVISPLQTWYWWFAWYPVKINGKRVWGCWVERRIVYDRWFEGHYEYR